MDKVILVGTDTMLGANLAQAWSEVLEVVGFDITELPAAEQIAEERPDWIVHCGRLAQSAWELQPSDPGWGPTQDEAEQGCRHEMSLVQSLLDGAAYCPSRLLLMSSDVSFAGPRIFHGESGLPTATGVFALTARQVESAVLAAGGLVIRSHAYGWSPGGHTIAERLWQSLASERTTIVDANRHATPILATDLADVVGDCMQHNLSGLFHVAGAERCSTYRFAAELAVSCGLTGRQVRLSAPPPMLAARPHTEETSLNTQTIRKRLGRSMPMLREGLARFVDQAYNGHREQIRSAHGVAIPRAA